MKKAIVFGTFDILHEGHKNFLKQAKSHGEKLVVVVARDDNVVSSKGRKPINCMEKRIESVNSLNIADKVIPGKEDRFFDIIWEENPDFICLGYDQDSKGIKKEIEKRDSEIKIVRLKPYKEKEYKTSLLRNKRQIDV